MPPTEPVLVGQEAADYEWAIDSNTVVGFVTLESIEEAAGEQKSEIPNQRGNVIALAFSRVGEKHYSLSGFFKGAKPAPGDTLDLQAVGEGAALKVVVGEDLKISESNSDWRKISCTASHYPDMTFA